MKLTRKQITGANHVLQGFLKPTYFEGVPLGPVLDVCNLAGVEFQEDEVPAILCGESGRCTVACFNADSMLVLAWHKMESGRYEVTGYLS